MERSDEAELTNARIQECLDRFGDGAVYDGVTVTYYEPEWVYARLIIKAECNDCGAYSVMQSDGYEVESKYLAHIVRTYSCDPLVEHEHEAINEGGDDEERN